METLHEEVTMAYQPEETHPGILLIAPDRNLAEEFKATFVEGGTSALSRDLDAYPENDVLAASLTAGKPAVAIDVSTDAQSALATAEAVLARVPDAILIALDHTGDADVLLECLRVGFREFLSSPFERPEQLEAIRGLLAPDHVKPEPNHPPATVLAFQSAKRGAGATSVAMQCALGLSEKLAERVLFIDLDLAGTTLSDRLPGGNSRNLIDFLERDADWPGSTRTVRGVDVLAGPTDPHCERLQRGQFARMLAIARERYQWIVIDVPSDGTQPFSGQELDAKYYFLVTALDPASLYVARTALHRLERFGIDDEHLRLILNMTTRTDLNVRQIRDLLACPVYVSFPADGTAMNTAGDGTAPVNVLTPFGKAVDEIVRRLLTERREQASLARNHTGQLAASERY